MSSKSTQKTSLDPQYSSLLYGNADRANGVANQFQPYTGNTVAGFNEAQKTAQQQYRDFAGGNVGGGLLDQATGAATGAAGYQPMQVSAQQINPQLLAGADLSGYMNPYQSSVIDATLGQLSRQNQIDLNNARARASSAGAWGGSGDALLQAQTQEGNNRNLASTVANLNAANYDQARQGAQFDIGNRLSADQFNANGALQAGLANQGAGLTGNAQRLQASGILSGLSDQQRAQGLQNIGLTSAVGDINQQQEQAQLDGWRQQYLDNLNIASQGQNVANSGVGLVPQTGSTTTKQSPGLSGILGAVGQLGLAAATGGSSLGLSGLGGLGGILGAGKAASGVLGGDVSQYAGYR